MEGYVKAPHDIVRDPTLSAMAKVAWLLIAGMPDGYHPTREEWMFKLPCGDKRTWWRVIDELQQAGLIEVTKQGTRNIYTAIQRVENNTDKGCETTPIERCENAPYKKNIIEEQKNTESEARTRLREEVMVDMMVEMGCRSCSITRDQYIQLTEEIFSDWEFADFPPDEWSKHHFLSVLRIKAKELKRDAVHRQRQARQQPGELPGGPQAKNPLADFPAYTKTGS